MYGSEIDEALHSYKERGSFLGVFANGEHVDFPVNSYCVMNTANFEQGIVASTELGTRNQSPSHPVLHWCLIGRYSNFLYEIFDPQPLLTSKFFYLFQGLSGSVIMNDQTLMPTQEQKSMMCGEFICYFFVKRQENLDLDFATLLNSIFTTDVNENASLVNTFMNGIKEV